MTSGIFDACFEVVIGHEGGYSTDPRDRGNWTSGKVGVGELKGTKYGIAAHVYPQLDIKNLTVSAAKDIYRKNYWDAAGCEGLADTRGGGYALAVFDTAINSGVGRALKFVQNFKSWDTYLDGRLYWLKTLDSWKDFGRGWGNRIQSLRAQCAQFDLVYPAAKPVSPVRPNTRVTWADGEVGRVAGVLRVYVNGKQIDLQKTGDVEDSVSIVGDKLYINTNTGGK